MRCCGTVILCREIRSPDCANTSRSARRHAVSRLAKWKTLIQMVAIGVCGARRDPDYCRFAAIGETLLWIAALLTIGTGYDYCKPASALAARRLKSSIWLAHVAAVIVKPQVR